MKEQYKRLCQVCESGEVVLYKQEDEQYEVCLECRAFEGGSYWVSEKQYYGIE